MSGPTDPKSLLNLECHARWKTHATYTVTQNVQENGQTGGWIATVCLPDGREFTGQPVFGKKFYAEQLVAKEVMSRLQLESQLQQETSLDQKSHSSSSSSDSDSEEVLLAQVYQVNKNGVKARVDGPGSGTLTLTGSMFGHLKIGDFVSLSVQQQ